MSRKTYYFTLISSLPHLPRFYQAERLPINRERLDERLHMLEPEDRDVVAGAEEFIEWQRQPVGRTDAEIVASFERMMKQTSQPVLSDMIDYRMNQRTIMVALRRRHRGLELPKGGEPWGVGRWVRHIEKNWDDLHFKLDLIHPWIRTARQLLEAGNVLELEKFLMERTWNYLTQVTEKYAFRFEAVLAFLFKWDILERWLGYDPEAATKNLTNLLRETTSEQRQLF